MIPADPTPFAAFIVRDLLHPVSPLATEPRAVSETAGLFEGDRWFWADDNGKVLEFMALPALWRRYPDEAAQVFRYLDELCEGAFIFRRTGHPRLEQLTEQEGSARFLHTSLSIECDLLRGIVGVAMRFHDGRAARNVTLTGNHVQFHHDGETYTLDVEDAIHGCRIDIRAPELALSHRSELRFAHRGAYPAPRRARLHLPLRRPVELLRRRG
jgi:hypothetical protein